jgi:DNA-binding MarR family transcriptional regulator
VKGAVIEMPRRRKSPSKVDLQAVLCFIGAAKGFGYGPLVAWIMATFGCCERAAKDNVSILVKGRWVAALQDPADRRRRRYVLTEKGRSDMRGHFGEGALRRGRRRYSTCLSGTARRRQALRIEAVDELADALENETRHLFGGLTYAELTQLGPDGRLPFRVRRRTRPRFDAPLRAELLGERSPAPGDKAGLCAYPREELLAERSLEIRDRLTFDTRLRAELLGERSAVQDDG